MGDINWDVARRNPSAAVAAKRANTTPAETTQIEQWTYLRDLDKKFRKMSVEQAKQQFSNLDDDVQATMRGVFGSDGYLEDANRAQGVFQSVKNFLTSPFRGAMNVAEDYNRTINAPWLNVGQALVGEEKVDLGKVLSKKTFDASWDGRALYDKKALSIVESQYDEATAFVAKQMLMGRRPGEIIEARGELDEKFVTALNTALNNPEAFANILDDFERAKLSPGRDLARRIFGNRKGSQGVVDKAFTAVSGAVDAVYQIAIDPLTYATGGLGTAASKGLRLAEIVSKGGSSSVARAFADDAVRRLWDDVGPKLAELGEARAAGNATKAGAVRRTIAEQYGNLDNDEVIDLLVKSEVKDANTAQSFFEQAENWQYLASGRVDNATFHRDGVATAYRTQGIRKWFNTQLKGIAQGRIEDVDVSKFDDITEGIKEIGRAFDNIPDLPENLRRAIDNENSFIQRARNIFSRHPGAQAIVWTDEGVEQTLPQVRALTRMLGFDKNFSYAFGEHFARSSQDQRIEMIRGLYTGIMRKQGADETFIKTIMDEKFGTTRVMGVTGDVVYPDVYKALVARNGNSEVLTDTSRVTGSLHGSQATGAVGAIPFDDLMMHIASQKAKNLSLAEPIKFVGGATQALFQSKLVTNITNVWNFFNLVPRLGMRTAIDEGFMGLMTMTNDQMKAFVHGRRLRNVQAAFTGSDATVGPVKAAARKLTGKGSFGIPDDVRRELTELGNVLSLAPKTKAIEKAQARALDTLSTKYNMSYADLVDNNSVSLIARYAMNLYGGKLPKEMQDLKIQHMIHNSFQMDASIHSLTARTANGTINNVTIKGQPLSPTAFDQMLIDEGIKFNKKFNVLTQQQIRAAGSRNWEAAWFKNAVVRLNGNVIKVGNDEVVNLGHTFFKHNGLKTEDDFANAIDEIMQKSGFAKQGEMWVVADAAKAKKATQWTADTAARMDAPQVDLANVYYRQTADRLSDIYHAFHGGPTKFNQNLLDYVRNADVDSMTEAFYKMDFDEYQRLTDGFLDSPVLNTDLVIPGINPDEPASWFQAVGNKAFDAMDKQATGMFRSPAYEASVMISALRMKPAQDAYVKKLIASGMKPNSAEYMAARMFTEIASKEAAGRLLKYVDNPEVRSQLAHSVKNVGRYYRATEDFIRRVYRLKDTKWTTLYRTRLMNVGLEGSGMMYTDSDGERYLMFPGDNILYNTLDSVISAFYGENKFMKSGQYNEFTMKFSLANPSLQEDAARPTVSGPVAALSVIGLRNMLGLVGSDSVDKWADDIDELFLGSMGKDAQAKDVVMPSVIRNIWRVLPTAERERQLSTAAMSAIAYQFDVNKPLRADATPQEKEQFMDSVRVMTGNVLFLRTVLGIFFPVTPTQQESQQLPDYLKAVGVTSLSQEYQSVLDGVFKAQARDEDFDGDPFEMALKIFAEKNPGKAIYTLSRSDKVSKALVRQNEEVKDWIISNRSLVKKYGNDAALMFAPQMGKYDQSSSKWFRQQGLTEGLGVEDFLKKAQVAELKNEYFRLGDEKTERMNATADGNERARIAANYEAKRKALKESSPMLADSLTVPSPNDEMLIYQNIRALAADENFPLSKLTRTRLQEMINTFERAYVQLTMPEQDYEVDYVERKANVRRKASEQLAELAGNDPQLKLAMRMVFTPIMRFYSRDIVSAKISRF